MAAIRVLRWLALAAPLVGQTPTDPPDTPQPAERWNLYYQATSIGDYHGTFRSPYRGLFSLQNYS
jgi:hypothetical protein